MTTTTNDVSQNWINLGLITGIFAAVLYGLPNVPNLPWRLGTYSFMAFGPVFCITVVGLYVFFNRLGPAVSNQLGHLFLFCAGLSFTHMATMQQSIFSWIPQQFRSTEGADPEVWQAILTSVSSSQLGLDFAFDIFVSVGTVLLGWQMVRHPKFWSWWGYTGMLIGTVGLAFNIITFPDNSGNAGLVDPGPFFGVWMSLSVIQVFRMRRWRPESEE